MTTRKTMSDWKDPDRLQGFIAGVLAMAALLGGDYLARWLRCALFVLAALALFERVGFYESEK